MPIYGLDSLVPQIHPDAYVHPDAVVIGDVRIGAQSSIWPGAVLRAGSVVGAKALVPEDFEVPTSHLALGIPVRPKPIDPKRQAEWIDLAVRLYVGNAGRYRRGLRRIDRPELIDERGNPDE